MGLTLLTPPSTEPVSVDAAKLHLRVDSDEENTLITTFISAARRHVENMTGRALLTQTWRYDTDTFPRYPQPIRLGRAPLQSVTTVKYYNTSGVLTTVGSSGYIVDTSVEYGEIMLAYGSTWPTARYQRNAISVEFVAGYGDDPEDVPQDLISAMLLMIGHLYANRESFITGAAILENPAMNAILAPYVVTLVA